MSDLAVEDVLLGVVVGAVQHLVAHAALEAPNVPLLTSSLEYKQSQTLLWMRNLKIQFNLNEYFLPSFSSAA